MIRYQSLKTYLFNRDDLFNHFFEMTLLSEGGYSSDQSDPGGLTAYGISSKANPEYAKKIKDGTFTVQDAKKVARIKYFNPIAPLLESMHPSLGYLIFDARFHGAKEVIQILQKGFNSLFSKTYSMRLVEDGIFGKKTSEALSKLTFNEVTGLISFFYSYAKDSARKTADRTINAQKKQGLPVKDYYDGFVKRNNDRYKNANKLYALV